LNYFELDKEKRNESQTDYFDRDHPCCQHPVYKLRSGSHNGATHRRTANSRSAHCGAPNCYAGHIRPGHCCAHLDAGYGRTDLPPCSGCH